MIQLPVLISNWMRNKKAPYGAFLFNNDDLG